MKLLSGLGSAVFALFVVGWFAPSLALPAAGLGFVYGWWAEGDRQRERAEAIASRERAARQEQARMIAEASSELRIRQELGEF